MEIEQEYKDESNISESQPHSPDEKHCKYCRTAIQIQALVCPHCRYHQRSWLNYFQQFGFVVSIALLCVSIWQFRVALEQRTKADEALQRASQIEDLTRQIQSLVDFNFILTKANADERKAFDDLWVISQTPKHGFQGLAHRAVESLVWSNIALFTQKPVLVAELELLDYSQLLNYYRQTSNVHSGSVLVAAHDQDNKRLTEEEKADFIAVMIDEDISFRVVQRACSYIRPRLERYRQVKPTSYDRVIDKCKIYGKIWGY
jgi:hypothetical protein